MFDNKTHYSFEMYVNVIFTSSISCLDYRISFRNTNTVLANMTVDDCGIGYSF